MTGDYLTRASLKTGLIVDFKLCKLNSNRLLEKGYCYFFFLQYFNNSKIQDYSKIIGEEEN